MAKVFLCGDIINQFSEEQFIGEKMIDCIQSCDYSVCNLEGVIDSGTFENHGMLQHPSTIDSLAKAGFNLCLLANNHITDYDIDGLVYTIKQLTFHNLACTGAGVGESNVYKPYIITIGEEKIGFINICEAQVGQFDSDDCNYGYAWIGWPDLDRIITETKLQVDFLFVCVHAGLEHFELPLKEFRSIYKRFCDDGADCIVGSHPHIAQGYEQYKESVIFYSLGNFYFPRFKDADASDYENNSFSIEFNTKEKSFELIHHSIQNRIVEIVNLESSRIDIERLNDLLLSEHYKDAVREQNDKAFDTLVLRLYRNALNGQEPSDSILKKIKNTVKYFFNLVNYNNSTDYLISRQKLLQRLVENETYRYLTIDVLKNRNNVKH